MLWEPRQFGCDIYGAKIRRGVSHSRIGALKRNRIGGPRSFSKASANRKFLVKMLGQRSRTRISSEIRVAPQLSHNVDVSLVCDDGGFARGVARRRTRNGGNPVIPNVPHGDGMRETALDRRGGH